MGKYFGSPWGFIRGKLNDAVGGYWKGIEWVRVRVFPTQRGTLKLYRLLKEGLITPERFSFKQMNIRRLVLQVLGWIGRTNLSTMIYPVWVKLCRKRKLKLTGINLFVRRNAPTLWASIPHRDQEYDATTNAPDMKQMLVSDGDLEPTPEAVGCSYNPSTGKFHMEWNMSCTKNGKPDDYAYILVYREPIIDPLWQPNGWLYGKAELVEPPAVPKIRANGTMEIDLPTGLTVTDLIGYVFFRDHDGVIGFSPSASRRAT